MPAKHRSRRFFLGSALLGACALSTLAPRIAEACSPPLPGLEHSLPADGAIYPANAALFFSGFNIMLDAVTVTVDGQPATLVPAEFANGVPELAVLVEPAPQEGQTVVVSGPFCDPQICDPITITYTAGPADVAAPEPLAEESFYAVYDHGDFLSSGGDCQSDSDLTLYVHLQQNPLAAGDAPSLFSVSWDPDGEGPAGFRRAIRATTDAPVIVLPLVTEQLGAEQWPTDGCLDIAAVDAAGNAAAPFQLCPACYFRQDDVVPAGSAPPEPGWTDADAVPGSACAGEVATTGEPMTTGDASDTDASTGDAGTGDGSTGSETTSPTTGAGTDGTGDTETPGGSDSTSDSASGGGTGGQGGEDGCACSSDGGGPNDAGRFLLFALGLGLALVKRRSGTSGHVRPSMS